jgi:hypothetical protein
MLDIDWSRDPVDNKYVIVECYRKLDPDTISLSGTITSNTSSNTAIGTGTVFDQQIVENDFINLSDGQSVQVRHIISPTELQLTNVVTANVTNVSMTKTGMSDVWNDRFLKQYATAKIKKQWGENLKKFGNIQMPGGVVLNGKEIWDEADAEIQKIEEEMQSYNILPSEMYYG